MIVAAAGLMLGTSASSVSEPRNFVLSHGNSLTVISTQERSVDVILSELGMDPEEYLYVLTEHESFTAVELYDALDVAVTHDGQRDELRASGGTVADQLNELGVTVGEDDMISEDPDAPIYDGIEIVIRRVTYDYSTEDTPVEHGAEYRDDPDLERGKTQVLTEGSDGLRRTKYKEQYIDGEFYTREKVEETLVEEPEDTVILRGTKVKPEPEPVRNSEPEEIPSTDDPSSGSSDDPSGGSSDAPSGGGQTFTTASGEVVAYTRSIRMTATAYTYSAGSITASGAPVQVGIVAALPSTIPQGTHVYITAPDGSWTYGFALVGDTPGGDILDLFMETEEECWNFGVRDALVYILD